MKVTTKGQVTIPRHIRGFLGISAHSEVDFVIRNGAVQLEAKPEDAKASPADRFARLRGSHRGMSTDEWLKATRGE